MSATFAAWAEAPQSANAAGPRFLISQHILNNRPAFGLAFCHDLSNTERRRLDKVLSDRAQAGAPVFQFSKDEAIKRAEEYALLVLHGDTQFDERYLIVILNMFQNILGFVFLEEVYVCSEGQAHDPARSTFMHQTCRNMIPEGAKLILPLHWAQPRDCPNDFHFNSIRLPGRLSVSPLVPMQALLEASPDNKSLSTGPQAFVSGPPAGFPRQQPEEASESEKPAFLFFMQYFIVASETVGSEKIRILHETVRTSLATYLEKIAQEGLVSAAGFGSTRFHLRIWIRRRKAALRRTTHDISRKTVAAIVAKAEGCTLQCRNGTRDISEEQFEDFARRHEKFISKHVAWYDREIPTSTESGACAGSTLQLEPEAVVAGGAALEEAVISSAGESIPGAAPADVPSESTAGAAATVAAKLPDAAAAVFTAGGDLALVNDPEAGCGGNTAAEREAGEGSALGVAPSLPGAEPEKAPLRTLPAADPVPRKSNTGYPTWLKLNAGPCGLSTGSSYAQALGPCGCPGASLRSARSGGDAAPAMRGAPGAGCTGNTSSNSALQSAPGAPKIHPSERPSTLCLIKAPLSFCAFAPLFRPHHSV